MAYIYTASIWGWHVPCIWHKHNTVADNIWRINNNVGCHEDILHSIVTICFNSNTVENSLICDKYDMCQKKKTTAIVNFLLAIKDGANLNNSSKNVSKPKSFLKNKKYLTLVKLLNLLLPGK